MNKGPIVVTVSLLLSVMLVLPPIAVSAGRAAGGGHVGAAGHAGFGGRAGFGSHVVGPRGFGSGHPFHRGFHQPFFHGRPFFNRRFGRFVPFGVVASPVLVYGWPYGAYGWPYFYGSALSPDPSGYFGGPGYGAPYPAAASPGSAAPTVYNVNIYNPAPAPMQPVEPAAPEPAPVSTGPAAPASPQGVVEYEGGRYELRGDGMTMPYHWVWIPNPPPGPPGSSAMRAPTSGEAAPARRGTIYRWVDDQGVLHVTDRWPTVPQRYREQAKQNLDS